ncbi:hypothetical protein Hypma_008217 [Hypsizygus marmoreus]|uniref:Golgi to ER traffic protein 2 n=1 Tax=Hypsizygus marmoreus TaxID=39966 RepID=A0A369JY82_HYPMA|nr:hypothetical protein Hypma_008217 [Hypsizygus marmoreus]
MSAAARAEARRKAILSRGSDRLAKLTTSARGEDAPAYMHEDPPLPNLSTSLSSFIGEESPMPTPPTRLSPSPSPRAHRASSTAEPRNPFAGMGFEPGTTPDPSVWSEQQQQQFLQALMAASPMSRSPESLPGLTPTDVDPTLPPMDNPFAAMLFPQGAGGGGFPPGFGAAGKMPAGPDATVEKPPTRLQKLMPFVHLITVWCLLAYFVLWKEPQIYGEVGGNVVGAGLWRRWAELGRSTPLGDVAQILKVQVVPFFWAFTTLQIVLHSVRIFSGFDAVQPPTLLAIALPHLPPPLPSVIVNALKYLQMGSLFLDDLSGLIVGLGFIVMFSGWLAV